MWVAVALFSVTEHKNENSHWKIQFYRTDSFCFDENNLDEKFPASSPLNSSPNMSDIPFRYLHLISYTTAGWKLTLCKV